MDETLASRVEDAGLNASAPPQQRWLDGWIVRYSPGKARRARCINAVATGRLPLDQKLKLAADVYSAAGLPMVVRITRFSLPQDLDEQLARRGYAKVDDTRVMMCPQLQAVQRPTEPAALPAGTEWVRLDAQAYAQAVGTLRGSPAEQRLAHAERLRSSPVPYRGYALRRTGDGTVLACGQYAGEAELVGLYDVFTRESERGRGLARSVCERLLSLAISEGARVGYLQVEADNLPARRIYRKLGFADAYVYHYRQAPGAPHAAAGSASDLAK